MIQINLLPVRQIKKRLQLYQQAAIFLASLVVLLAILGGAAASMANKAADIQKDLTALNKKKASFQIIIKEIEQLKKDKQALEKKLEAIKQLKKGSQQPVRVLDALATLTPADRLWLKSLKQSPDKLQISGVALDNATIAQYMNDLTQSPYFTAANLGSTKLAKIGGRKLKTFTLDVTIKQETPVEATDSKTKQPSKGRHK